MNDLARKLLAFVAAFVITIVMAVLHAIFNVPDFVSGLIVGITLAAAYHELEKQ